MSVGGARYCRPCGAYLAARDPGDTLLTTNAALATEGQGHTCAACGAAVAAAEPPVYILARGRATPDYWQGYGRGLGTEGGARVVAVGARDASYVQGRLRSGMDLADGRVFPSPEAALAAALATG